MVDLTGKQFGRLTVLRQHGKNAYSQVLWLCRCECGNQYVVMSSNLIAGHVKSCGCLLREWRQLGKRKLQGK